MSPPRTAPVASPRGMPIWRAYSTKAAGQRAESVREVVGVIDEVLYAGEYTKQTDQQHSAQVPRTTPKIAPRMAFN